MSSETNAYIKRTAASLETRRKHILDQQETINEWEKKCHTINVDVSTQIENVYTTDSIRMTKLHTILEFALELQEFLLRIQT